MLPFGFYDAFRCEICPDLCPLQSPVRSESILLLIEGKIRIPPLKERHDDFGKRKEELKLGGKVPAFQHMLDIPPHINSLCGIVVIRQISLIFGQSVRQIRRSEDHAIFPKMILIPWKRIVVERITAENFTGRIGVEQVVHEEHVVHVLFVKYRQIVNFLLIRKKTLNRMKVFSPFADLRYNEILRDKTFRKQKACLPVCIYVRKLADKALHISILFKMRRCFYEFFGRMPVSQIGPGKLHKKSVVMI